MKSFIQMSVIPHSFNVIPHPISFLVNGLTLSLPIITTLKDFKKLHPYLIVMSVHLYLYSAFYGAECTK